MAKYDYFSVMGLQPNVCFCNSRSEIYDKNLRRLLELLDFQIPLISQMTAASCKLVVFPEFGLHGIPSNPDGSWNGVAIDIPGKETELLGQKAKELNIYIAAHAWTEYSDFPKKPFSVGFLIAPSGEVILKHHKIVTTKIAESASTAPGDAYDWFINKFGDSLDSFFPVADTEIGKIGFQICGEGQYAEISRGLMMNGAEIIVRPNAWLEPFMTEPQDSMTLVSRFNAFANMCYLIESNWASIFAPGFPQQQGPGRSQIIDYAGRIIAKVNTSGETAVASEINLNSLRRYREESAFISRMVFMPNDIFSKVYETEMWPRNSLMNRKTSGNIEMWEQIRRQVIEKRRDIYRKANYM